MFRNLRKLERKGCSCNNHLPSKKKTKKIKKCSVILVDDIYTTGRTLFHAAAVINDCYPKSLNTFTRAIKRKEFINLMTILLAKPRLFDIMKLRRRELKSGPLIFSLLVDERGNCYV